MSRNGLEFEKPLFDLEKQINELRRFVSDEKLDGGMEKIVNLERRLQSLQRETYTNLTPWQRVQVARHLGRPYTLDYAGAIMTDFMELHGDRAFQEDGAIVAGPAKFEGRRIILIGHQKGRDTKENLRRNFGSAHPEGYRKALRLMKMAERFGLPVVTMIDTPGAYPGIGAEERGQAEAIAVNLEVMSALRVPIIVLVIGEGGSGGALGLGVGDRICVMENAYYSVISPEGCASILWRDRAKAPQAAECLKLTAQDLLRLKVIDEIVPEPLGGAHHNHAEAFELVRRSLLKNLEAVERIPIDTLLEQRYQKFRRMGVVIETKE